MTIKTILNCKKYLISKLFSETNKNKKAILYSLLASYGLFTAAKENGLLAQKDVRNKHVFLTGAGSGIGRLMTIIFSELGANLTISDINMNGLEETAQMVRQKTGSDENLLLLKLNVADRVNITEVARAAEEKFGAVDILINNAGIVQGKLLTDMNEKMTSLGMIVNAESHIWICRELLPAMMERNSGQIVSISSIAGVQGLAYGTDYCASKFAAFGFQESLRNEMKYLGKNIKCTTICPYFINTGMFEGTVPSLQPLLDQHYVANRIITAIRQEEEEVSLPWYMGTTLHLLKGFFPSTVVDQMSDIFVGNHSLAALTGRPTPKL